MAGLSPEDFQRMQASQLSDFYQAVALLTLWKNQMKKSSRFSYLLRFETIAGDFAGAERSKLLTGGASTKAEECSWRG